MMANTFFITQIFIIINLPDYHNFIIILFNKLEFIENLVIIF